MLSLLCQILIAFVLNVGILYVILTVCQPKKCPSAQQKSPNMVIPPFMEGTAQAQVQNASQPTSTAANPAFAFIAARPTSQPAFRQTGSAAAVARSSATA
ncbi:hypothetical protein Tcan_15138 [Toxocara canis]|uniref:Uncharacterized protein n=1 Tax=Toxocara canis TaxID=6265 RepID=A0A0B2V814_TOXCA|nr:hypothetical protein Tcan_15138 [Toxocara canis]